MKKPQIEYRCMDCDRVHTVIEGDRIPQICKSCGGLIKIHTAMRQVPEKLSQKGRIEE